MIPPGGTWRVVTTTVDALEAELNGLARDGFAIFSVLPVGVSEPQSNVPRERRSLEARTTFAIVACRPAA